MGSTVAVAVVIIATVFVQVREARAPILAAAAVALLLSEGMSWYRASRQRLRVAGAFGVLEVAWDGTTAAVVEGVTHTVNTSRGVVVGDDRLLSPGDAGLVNGSWVEVCR